MPKVLIAQTPEERIEIYRFRYKIYVEEMQKQPRYADHTQRILNDELDETAILLYITVGDQIVATLRRNLYTHLPAHSLNHSYALDRFTAAFPKQAISLSSRLMVAPEWRNSSTLGAIVTEAYRHAREVGIQFDFSHAAPWLVPFYENLGYRRYTDSFFDRDAGLQIPMVLLIEDVDHLRRVRSPFYRLARKAPNCAAAANWFTTTFPEQAAFINTCSNTADQVWEVWVNKLHQSPQPPLNLLQGLPNECIQQLLKSSVFHQVKAGETILRIGDIANAVFLVLSGVVETNGMGKSRQCQTFGETTLFTQLPSPESAIALTDVELLVLPRQTILKAMKTAPDAMCQFFFNASRWLCDKYVSAHVPADQAEPAELVSA